MMEGVIFFGAVQENGWGCGWCLGGGCCGNGKFSIPQLRNNFLRIVAEIVAKLIVAEPDHLMYVRSEKNTSHNTQTTSTFSSFPAQNSKQKTSKINVDDDAGSTFLKLLLHTIYHSRENKHHDEITSITLITIIAKPWVPNTRESNQK